MQTSKVVPQDIEKARTLLVAFNRAVLDGDPVRAHDAHMAYDALVHSLNGGTSFGSYAAEDSPCLLYTSPKDRIGKSAPAPAGPQRGATQSIGYN